jgi:hypothetical protein
LVPEDAKEPIVHGGAESDRNQGAVSFGVLTPQPAAAFSEIADAPVQ